MKIKKGKKRTLSSVIRTQEFSLVGGLGKKGYNPDEVRDFLNRIARQVEELEKKAEEGAGGGGVDESVIQEYKERIETLETQLEMLAKENEELKKKLVELSETSQSSGTIDWDSIPEDKLATDLLRMAKETGDRIVEQKRREAEELLKSAQAQAEEIIREAQFKEMELQKRLSLLKAEIEEAERKRASIRDELKNDLLNLARKIEEFATTLE